jgi:NTP pyrophosphatase (non-canonical NTP hydrolase)
VWQQDKQEAMVTKFEGIYSKQEEFENLLIFKSKSLPDKLLKNFDQKEKTAFSKELALLLHQEISEFINAVGNYKLHKIQQDGKSVKEIKEEIADMFIFVLDMALTHNMTAEELLNEVIKKQDKNFERQRTGY